MHHALKLDEILLNIFAHCQRDADLVILARTCGTFKEPALDVLWSDLQNLTPLARCLPDVSDETWSLFDMMYSFKRPLEQAEWETLRSYTRRVLSIRQFEGVFTPDTVRKFLTPPTPEPLFPNIRHISFRYVHTMAITPLLCQPFPSVVSLTYDIFLGGDASRFEDLLSSLPTFFPAVKRLVVITSPSEDIVDKFILKHISCLSNLQVVRCPRTSLDLDTLTHLSRAPGLTQLSFTLNTTLPVRITPSHARLPFQALQRLNVRSTSLHAVSGLLAHIQLPMITRFDVEAKWYPSEHTFGSFLSMLHTSCIGDTLTTLIFTQWPDALATPGLTPIVLSAHGLSPGTVFRSLRHVEVIIDWHVGLTDDDLLVLASAWPNLEVLIINEEAGWCTPGGITPNGLMRLLETCQLLGRISLAIDTRGYTDIPPIRPPPARVDPELQWFSIDVVDSEIEDASVPAIAAFLANIVPSPLYVLFSWMCKSASEQRLSEHMYPERWRDVKTRMAEAVAERYQVLD